MGGNFSKLLRLAQRRVVPSPTDPIQARRVELARSLYAQFAGEVAYGPFKGTKLASVTHWGSSVNSHQLLGLYEQELLHALFDVPRTHRTFVEIGSQDGYYAAGALRAGLFDRAHCFETRIEGQKLIADNCKKNGVGDRVEIYGEADRNFTSQVRWSAPALDKSVILCDTEGAEFQIFDSRLFEIVKGAVIFIELHPFAVKNGAEAVKELKEAAAPHFVISELTTAARDLSVFPELDGFSDTDRWLLCSEGRPVRMTWLRLDPIVK